MTRIRRVRVVAILAVQMAFLLLLVQPSVGAVSWLTPERITSSPDGDLLPYAIEFLPGINVLVWQSVRYGAEFPDIYYKVNAGFGWSEDFPLTVDAAQDLSPTLVKLANGTLLVIWSSNRAGNFDLYSSSYNGTYWSLQKPIAVNPADDHTPAAIVDRSGTLWLVWMRNSDLYYMTNSRGVWSGEARLTNDPHSDRNPSITATKDGRLWILWDSPRTSGVDTDIYARVFDAGVWGPELRLTTSIDYDWHPAVVQDRDGTIWVFWSRDLPLGGMMFQTELYYKTSTDNGLSWSGETRLTVDSSSLEPVEDDFPVAIQSSDKRLWLFFESTRDGNFEIYLFKTIQIPTHDVGISRASLSASRVRVGDSVTIVVDLKNFGDWSETFNFQVRANTTTIRSETVTLATGQATSKSLLWSSLGLAGKSLVFTASAGPVAGETIGNSGDNTVVIGTVCVLYRGDVNQDGVVNIIDLVIVGGSFGKKAGEPGFDPRADLNNDGTINILDLVIVAGDFVKKGC